MELYLKVLSVNLFIIQCSPFAVISMGCLPDVTQHSGSGLGTLVTTLYLILIIL